MMMHAFKFTVVYADGQEYEELVVGHDSINAQAKLEQELAKYAKLGMGLGKVVRCEIIGECLV